ncbi:glycosyltransferase family 2 protein [Chachezhania sediminis]|uniref:glycosyltransferase family 2 protein n=1 Tax=Chachezhania sediminis TaxID=2599291 RepID=UPI00131D4CF9|nr:glycosyltransferase family 2 protein [Chachezhania sediminis]
MEILAVTTMRNEAAFLLDWLAHHLACGFTHVLAFTNDCDDGTDLLLDRLAEMGLVTHLRNDGPYDRRGKQFTALNRAHKLDVVKRADWILPCDIDEFVNIHVGGGTIPDLLEALPAATAIPLTWRLFGNGGVVEYEDRPVPDIFTRAAPRILNWPWRAGMFKTLYRNDGTYRKLGIHRPRDPKPQRLDTAHWVDGSGRPLDPAYRTERIFSPLGRDYYGLVQLNHYPLGAMESFVLKADRGRVNVDAPLRMDYWVERNFSDEVDTSIARMAGATAEHRARLGADPVLAELHAAAVKWRHARFGTLMLEEPWRALFGRLMMTPPARALPREEADRLLRHALKARALRRG